MLKPGLYEQLINDDIRTELDKLPEKLRASASLDEAEAAGILARYLGSVLEQALNVLSDQGRSLDEQIRLARRLVLSLAEITEDEQFAGLSPDQSAELLYALLEEDDPLLLSGKSADDLPRPESPMSCSSLFPGDKHEPQMYSELKNEIYTADRIDMLVSFIKWSGLRLIIDDLEAFCAQGGTLRVITTTYMGATDAKAIEALHRLPNCEIKVSYDTKRTRLHAKSYIFHRESGFSTAYIGSSNISHAALSGGLEWNMKITEQDQHAVMQKIEATFEVYRNHENFLDYTDESKARLRAALTAEKHGGGKVTRLSYFDLRPYPFQQEILDKLQAERSVHARFKNLVVAATGTGKTFISAFDYKRFAAEEGGRPRFLFVAHRSEILQQSLRTYREVLRDENFGELMVGRFKPASLEHLFVSVQSLNSKELCTLLPSDFYDYIVVDEFHHAAAETYQQMLEHFKPKILLGLTATPERADGKDILNYFDGRIAAEIRLPEAIERKLLSPFQYFVVSDPTDLSKLRWSRGGYDRADLNRVFTIDAAAANKRAELILRSLDYYVTSLDEVKGLGFCVSVDHAHFMADYFNAAGIPSLALSGQSDDALRFSAKDRLLKGELRFIFVVDIYNEGVDIPEVNTVLFLRPTESLTIFLQQLGRGLRLAEGKDCLTVLDFVGRAHKRYNFAEKFSALLTSERRSLKYEIKHDFISAPAGCYIRMEKAAQGYILDNIKQSLTTKRGLITRLQNFREDSGRTPGLKNFLDYYRLDPRLLYKRGSFSRLAAEAGLREDFHEAHEKELTKALARLASADSGRWIRFLKEFLPQLPDADLQKLSAEEKRMFNMFAITVWGKAYEDLAAAELQDKILGLTACPVLFSEMLELLDYLFFPPFK